MGCPGEMKHRAEPNQLHLISFWGLYLLCGIFTLGALLVFLLRMIWQFVRYKRHQRESSHSSSVSSNPHCSQVISSFFNFIDEKEEAIKKMFKQHDNRQEQI